MGRRIVTLGVCVIFCAGLLACGPDSYRRPPLPTGATPNPTPSPTPNPTPPPQGPFTVSGVVSEVVDGRILPLEGAHVEDSERHVFVKTAADGSYTLTEVAISSYGGAYIYFAKPGFRSQSQQFPLTGDKRLDVTLVRE